MFKEITDQYELPSILKNRSDVTHLILGDAHCGSRTGLLPPNILNKRGVEVTQSQTQKNIWNQLVANLKNVGKVDVLIVGGDWVEGKQIHAAGLDLHDSDTDVQVKIGVESLKRICEISQPDYILFVEGTDYHIARGVGGVLDYQVAQLLGATLDIPIYYGTTLNVKIGELVWNIEHRIAISNTFKLRVFEKIFDFYRRDFDAQRINVIPDVIVRFHHHVAQTPIRIEHSRWAIRGGCLKEKDTYLQKQSYPSNPDLGIMIVRQNGEYLDEVDYCRCREEWDSILRFEHLKY